VGKVIEQRHIPNKNQAAASDKILDPGTFVSDKTTLGSEHVLRNRWGNYGHCWENVLYLKYPSTEVRFSAWNAAHGVPLPKWPILCRVER